MAATKKAIVVVELWATTIKLNESRNTIEHFEI